MTMVRKYVRQIRGLGEEQRGNPVSQLGSYVELPGRKKRNRDEESRNRPPGGQVAYYVAAAPELAAIEKTVDRNSEHDVWIARVL